MVWSGRRVAITGHTGFKGAWLSYMLQRSGAEVWGFALPPKSQPNLYDALVLGGVVKSTFGDIRDECAVEAFFSAARPDVVFHFAAQSLVRCGYDDPVNTFDVNIQGTAACLQQSLRYEVPVTIVATSDKCYRNGADVLRPFSEDDALGGPDPYSASKGAAEIVIDSYRSSFFRRRNQQLASVRAGNVIGGGDWSCDRLFADLARAAFEEQPMLLRYPAAVRPWQHVLDALRAYVALAEAALQGARIDEAWNVGPNELRQATVAEIIALFEQCIGKKIGIERSGESEKPEAAVLRLDSGKIRRRLGWRPRFSLEASVELTAQWYDAYYSGASIRELTEAQIDLSQTVSSMAG